MKRISVTILTILLTQTGHAGIKALTHHSRANCINNETISWHKGHSYWLKTIAEHYWVGSGQLIHTIVSNPRGQSDYTWRAAAVCWGEGKAGWLVKGYHYLATDGSSIGVKVASTNVTDCSIYDGWWD